MRAALSFALFSVRGCSFFQSFVRPTDFNELCLDLLPLELHWRDKRAISAALVDTFLLFDFNVKQVGSISKKPQLSLLLIEIGVPRSILRPTTHLFLPPLLHWRFLAGS